MEPAQERERENEKTRTEEKKRFAEHGELNLVNMDVVLAVLSHAYLSTDRFYSPRQKQRMCRDGASQ